MNFHPFQGLQDLPDLPDAAHASREDLVAEMLGLQAHPLPGPTPAALRVLDPRKGLPGNCFFLEPRWPPL